MPVAQLNSCCCGCSLRTGTLIIGWLNMVVSLLLLIASTSILVLGYVHKDDDHSSPETKNVWAISKVFGGVLFVFAILFIGLAAMLLIGVYKDKPRLVFNWVIITFVLEVLRLLTCIYLFIVSHRPNMIFDLVGFVVSVYLLLVVYSFYRNIRDKPAATGPV